MPQPLPKPPNQELITHEKKRQIEAQVFAYTKQLKSQGDKSEDQIKSLAAKKREDLKAELTQESARDVRDQKVDLRDKH